MVYKENALQIKVHQQFQFLLGQSKTKNFLDNRKLRVRVNGTFSIWHQVKQNAAQRYDLGPRVEVSTRITPVLSEIKGVQQFPL